MRKIRQNKIWRLRLTSIWSPIPIQFCCLPPSTPPPPHLFLVAQPGSSGRQHPDLFPSSDATAVASGFLYPHSVLFVGYSGKTGSENGAMECSNIGVRRGTYDAIKLEKGLKIKM